MLAPLFGSLQTSFHHTGASFQSLEMVIIIIRKETLKHAAKVNVYTFRKTKFKL